MSETNDLKTSPESTEDEPIYYSPNRLSLIASIASWFSWFVFVAFIADTIIQGIGIQSQLNNQGLVLTTLLSDPSFLSYIFANLLTPFFTGIALFLILQAVSIGLNVVLEMDFNMREDKSSK
jgi:hypothetical protein